MTTLAPGSAHEQVVAAAADQDVVAGSALEAVIAVAAVEPGGNGRVVVHLDIIVAGLGVDHDATDRHGERPAKLVTDFVVLVDANRDEFRVVVVAVVVVLFDTNADRVVARAATEDEHHLSRIQRIGLKNR